MHGLYFNDEPNLVQKEELVFDNEQRELVDSVLLAVHRGDPMQNIVMWMLQEA